MRPVARYTVVSAIPESLIRLTDLAYNLRWSWDHETIDLFRRMSRDLWEETNHNPVKMLGMLGQSRFNALARDEGFIAQYERVLERFDEYMQHGADWQPQIAYFSFEYGLTECIPNYSGGLGILSGDHLKAASDRNLPLVGMGLLYQQGYFRQYLNIEGWQQERYPENDFYTMPIQLVKDEQGDPVLISVDLLSHEVFAQIWQIQVGRIPLYLLDTNISRNALREDQDLTDQLYGGDREMRIRQEILLGIGGLRALQALGIDPAVCHINEGHSAFMTLERTRLFMQRYNMGFSEASTITSASNIFTTHTPVPAGNDYFHPDLVEQYLGTYRQDLGLSRQALLGLGRMDPSNDAEELCMTILALRMSAYANGVSRLHGEVARKMWQDVYPDVPLLEVPIGSITNGVHTFSWISHDMASLYDRYLGPRWREDPADWRVWRRVADIPSEELWRTHERRRERLVAFARKRLVGQLEARGASSTEIKEAHEALDPDVLTIGFARRFATYKRATLLLRDPERFERILRSDHPVQFIFAGKAHPHDNQGKEFIRDIIHFASSTGCRHRIVFLEDYDMVVARYLVQGVDVWLNTPRRPMEASGTSGMKASMNGVLNLSVIDGWWAEAYRRDLGWAIGHGENYDDQDLQDYIESNAVYELLEKEIVPLFYDRGADDLPRNWIMRMKSALRELCPVYSMARMVQDYAQRFYYPALDQHLLFSENDMERGRACAAWKARLDEHWGEIDLGDITTVTTSEVLVGDMLHVAADIFLGDSLTPDDIAVQVYEGELDRQGQINRGHAYTMENNGEGYGGTGWYHYETTFTTEHTGRRGYTIRVIPHHPDMSKTLRLGLITWA